MENDQQQPDNNQQRPRMLTLLCILTFLGSGLSAFANLVLFAFYDLFHKMFEAGQFDLFKEQLDMESFKVLMDVDSGFFLFQGLLYLLSLSGAVMMWNLRKTGFHFYAVAQILLLIVYELYFTGAPFPLMPLIITIIFILLYFRNLKYLK